MLRLKAFSAACPRCCEASPSSDDQYAAAKRSDMRADLMDRAGALDIPAGRAENLCREIHDSSSMIFKGRLIVAPADL